MGEAMVMDSPPLKIICRSMDATKIFTGPPAVGRAGELLSGSSSLVAFSNDGGWMCAVGEETVDLIGTHTMQQVRSLPITGILFVGFSPQANYLVTCQRPMKGVGVSNKNLQVWEVATGRLVWEFHQRAVSDENWPALHWQDDEALTFHMVTNTIQAHDPATDFQGAVCKLPLQGVAGFSVSPGLSPKIAAYVAQAKGQPASVGIYPVDRLPKDKSTDACRTNRKSFYRVSGVAFLWNSLGSAVLCNSYSDVDVTNKNYYGEQHLHFMDANTEDSCQVPNLAEGPIHDVQWSPKGDFFAVVAGFMPAKTLLFNAKCKPIYDFGSGPHNFIRWNPQGRFLCIAGFGNLPGDIVFWEKKANGTCKKIAGVRSPSVSLEWSPSGRHVLTAITTPRLRVDNSFKVITYYGDQIYAESFGELFEAKWVPAPTGLFPDRPVSPERVRGGAESSTVQEESPPSAYVPPHLRGRGGKSSAPQFSLGHSTDQAGRIRSAAQQQQQESGVPGATFVSKSAQKNARRRAKKTTGKPEADEGENVGVGQGQFSTTTTGSSSQVETAAQGVAKLDMGTMSQMSSTGETEKKIRNLKKKLRQIASLKEKVQSQGEGALSKEQLEKLASEPKLLEELQSLERE